MTVTLHIDDALAKDLEALAVDSGRSVSELVHAALRSAIVRSGAPAKQNASLPVAGHDMMVRPGVDLSNFAALLDIMDGLDDPS